MCAPGGSGKTCALVSMLLSQYRGCWARLYIISPSIHLDSAWLPVKKYSEEVLGVDQSKEQTFFDKWDPQALQGIVDQQIRITEYSKKRGLKKLHGIVLIVDDIADDPRVVHSQSGASAGGSMLNTAFIRLRHAGVSTIISTQKLRLLSSTIRCNCQAILLWKCRNGKELEAAMEECSALHSKEEFMAMYRYATDKPHGFLFIDLVHGLFYSNFSELLKPSSSK